MIASLGMYDFGAAQAANDRLWALIRDGLRARGIAAPEALTRGEHAYWDAWAAQEAEHWRRNRPWEFADVIVRHSGLD